MRYMPTFRSPVSGSCVTTQGKVMNRPPSSGQHFKMGRSASVGGVGDVPFFQSPADGQFLAEAGASNLWITSLHGPLLTIFGFAWRKSIAWPSSLRVSRSDVGGLAFIRAPNSAAAASTFSAPRLNAIRLWEPSVLMATGKGETTPFTVGFS